MATQSKLTSIGIVSIVLLAIMVFYLLEITNAYTLPTRGGIQATIEVAVPPALGDWVQQAAKDFNEKHGQIEVNVISLKGTEAQSELSAGESDLPDVWIAEADFVRLYASGVPYEEDGDSIAQDSFIWVALPQKIDPEGNLNWLSIHDMAENNLQFRIALPVRSSTESMAACMLAAAMYHQQAILGGNLVNDTAFQSWSDELLNAVPNRDQHPVDQLNNRPPQVDVGLLFNSDWQGMNQASFITTPATYQVIFNYPFLIRNNWFGLSTDKAETQQIAAEQFREFLLSKDQQNKLQTYNFELANTVQTDQSVQIDREALISLRRCWQ